MNETWKALAREAGLAAEHVAIGVTTLSRANYAQDAYYGQAFFALTIGLERTTKLALVVDHALENQGQFPTQSVLRGYGHNLKALLEKADQIAGRRGLSKANDRLPRSDIHKGIVEVLSDFASNVTRYYNLDLVTGDPRAQQTGDPVKAWFRRVTLPVLAAHYKPHHRERHERNAYLISELLENIANVTHHSEEGELMDNVYAASFQTGMTEFAKPYTRMYVMQIARFLAAIMSELTFASYHVKTDNIPHLSEFFAIFNNGDDYFRQRKTWSIYGG